jgi:hypothetical protein
MAPRSDQPYRARRDALEDLDLGDRRGAYVGPSPPSETG